MTPKRKLDEGEGGERMSARPQRRSGNLSALKVELWTAIRAASGMLDDAETTPELKLRAVSAIATAAAVYARILEGGKPNDPKASAITEDADTIVIRVREAANGHHRV
jgi:hypothetical protein